MDDCIPDSTYFQNSTPATRREATLLHIRHWMFGDDSAGITDAWIIAYLEHLEVIILAHGWNRDEPGVYERAVRFDLTERGLL